MPFNSLTDFSRHENERIRNFSGKVIYQNEFTLEDPDYDWLDLGDINDFICEVELNDQRAGLVLYGRRRLAVGPQLRAGRNRLRITYTTTLWNHVRNSDWAPFWFGNFSRNIPDRTGSGILGPVRLQKH
jgi:hypothetical protein